MTSPALSTTLIPGLLVLRLPVHEDSRGWFKEGWNHAALTAIGLPDFGPVQHNVSFNAVAGTIRGVHAEPWDKLVSVASGRAWGAWVDLREGPGFGAVVTHEITPDVAVYIPRGVGNAFQVLEDGTAYSYLVNDHWRPDLSYPAVHPGDTSLAIDWPLGLDPALLSEKDRGAPALSAITPVGPPPPVVLGAAGQLGRALLAEFPGAVALTRDDLDLTDPEAVRAYPWDRHEVVINAAAMTAVDAAETAPGRRTAWQVNAHLPALLARLANEHRFTLVHYSTDYVFDGEVEVHHEDESFAPLSVYGQSKAAGDLAVSVAARHYLLRTSWLVGEGSNFVATMTDLAARGVSPSVVDDQRGRLTTTAQLAGATARLLRLDAPHGTYHVSGDGPVRSWADIAADVFAEQGRSPEDVRRVSTSEYAAGRTVAPRPRHSTLSLDRLARAVGGSGTNLPHP